LHPNLLVLLPFQKYALLGYRLLHAVVLQELYFLGFQIFLELSLPNEKLLIEVEDFLLGFKDLGLEVFHVGFQVAD
jgi:hypothetical protein